MTIISILAYVLGAAVIGLMIWKFWGEEGKHHAHTVTKVPQSYRIRPSTDWTADIESTTFANYLVTGRKG